MSSLVSRFRVDLLLLIVAATWGSTYLAAKELVTPSTVMPLLAVRMLLAAAVMGTIVTMRGRRMTAAELRAGVVLGMLLAAVFVLETFGIAHTSATNAGLIISLTIVVTPILDSMASGVRLPGTFLLAATTAVIGVALLAGNGALRAPSLGDLLILAAAVVRAVHVTSMPRLTGNEPMDTLHLTTVQLATCAAVFSVGSMSRGASVPQYVAQLDLARASLLLYLVLACTVFAFFVQIWAVRRTSPSRVSLLLGTEPVWAAFLGMTVAHDRLGPVGWCGVVLILAGTAWGRSLEQNHRRIRSDGGTYAGRHDSPGHRSAATERVDERRQSAMPTRDGIPARGDRRS